MARRRRRVVFRRRAAGAVPVLGFAGAQRLLWIGSALAVGTLIASALLFWVFEHASNDRITSVGSGFIWVTRTLLEQSSPWDITTGAGTAIYYVVLLAGVSLAAMATAAIASKLVELVIRKGGGMGDVRLTGHIVICGWNSKGPEILRELHAEEVEDKRAVVILAPLTQSPSRDRLTTFLRGNPHNGEDLLRAAIDQADTAILLADESNPHANADDIDAKTLLTALAVESINPRCHTCVEVLRSENRQHFQRTKTDEMVVSSELTGALLATSASTHGITRVVGDLITHPEGNEFYSIPPPPEIVGRPFGEALRELKERYDCVVMALAEQEGDYAINPPADRIVEAGNRLLVISRAAPAARAADMARRG
ncbi:MAG: TrkA family potassium uptake protein [Actinomycetota bacterium]